MQSKRTKKAREMASRYLQVTDICKRKIEARGCVVGRAGEPGLTLEEFLRGGKGVLGKNGSDRVTSRLEEVMLTPGMACGKAGTEDTSQRKKCGEEQTSVIGFSVKLLMYFPHY